MVSAEEIIKKLQKEDIQILRRTFDYYKQQKIIFEAGWTRGKEGGPLALYDISTLNRLREIYKLKGKGLRLGAIKKHLIEMDYNKEVERIRNTFYEQDGRFYKKVEDSKPGDVCEIDDIDAQLEAINHELRSDKKIKQEFTEEHLAMFYNNRIYYQNLIRNGKFDMGRNFPFSMACLFKLFLILNSDEERLLEIDQATENFSLPRIPFFQESDFYTREQLEWDRMNLKKDIFLFIHEYATALLGGNLYELQFWYSFRYEDLETFFRDLKQGQCFIALPFNSDRNFVLKKEDQENQSIDCEGTTNV